jgi:hypothetical protein
MIMKKNNLRSADFLFLESGLKETVVSRGLWHLKIVCLPYSILSVYDTHGFNFRFG